MIYLEDPMPHIPVYNGRGRQPKKLKTQSEAIRVDQWASEQPDTAWLRETGESLAFTRQKRDRRKRNIALLLTQRAT